MINNIIDVNNYIDNVVNKGIDIDISICLSFIVLHELDSKHITIKHKKKPAYSWPYIVLG